MQRNKCMIMNYAKQKHSPGNSCVGVIKVTNTKKWWTQRHHTLPACVTTCISFVKFIHRKTINISSLLFLSEETNITEQSWSEDLLELRSLHLLLFLSGLVVSVLCLQLPGAFVSSLVVVRANFLHDFFQVGLKKCTEMKWNEQIVPKDWI